MESRGVMFEGKTLDDAVRKGLEALGLSRAEVMIQVMEEGSSGFLGIGSRPYKVRMMPRPRRESAAERPERRGTRDRDRGGRAGRERSDRGGRGERSGERRARSDGGAGAERSSRGERGDRGPAKERPAREGRPEREARAPQREESAPVAEMRREEDADRPRRRRRRGRSGGDGGREAPPREAHASHENQPLRTESEAGGERVHEPLTGNGPEVPAGELADKGRQLAEDLFRAMGFEAQVTARAETDSVEVKAEIGQDSELITGEKGEVRQSIQHLLNRMLNRGGTSRYHLQLEINDFWARRETELKEMAQRLADEAVADDSEKLTEYLNAQERRVVHVTLRDDSRVKTFGLGDGMIKKVAIAPVGADEEQKPGS